MEIDIADKALRTLIEDAEQAYPRESYGFLYGQEHGDRHIVEVMPVVYHQYEGARRYEISQEDFLSAERYALAQELRLLGIYHTHPDQPAMPSSFDLKQAVPYFSYVILAVEQGKVTDITSWQLAEHGAFEEETISNHIKQ